MKLVRTQRIGEKNGSKRHLLVDARGVPLSIVVTGANRHDVKELAAVLDGKIISLKKHKRQNLCADKAYVGKKAVRQIRQRKYIPHVRQRREEKVLMKKGFKPRRWVVEACHSWFNRFRKLLVRYEKKASNYLALLHLAASIICFRKCNIIYG